jgi:septal ring factor EnvC (AmiA/AmiB activator)
MAYAGSAVGDLRRRVITAHACIGDASAEGGIRFTSWEGRPSVEIDVRGLAGDAAGPGRHVELVLRRDAEGAVAADALAQVLESVARERDATRADFARIARTLATLSARIDGTSAAIGMRVDAAAGPSLAERIEAFAAAGAARDARVAGLERQLAALVDAIARSEQSLAALAPLIERATSVQAASEAAAANGREVAARDREDLRQRLMAVQTEIERVNHSVENLFWRRWLRRLRGGGR